MVQANVSVRRRLERDYFIHYGDQKNCALCGSLPRQDGKWFDYSPDNNHGTIDGATWTRLSSGLWALDFDGTNDKVDIPATAGSIKSFAAWVYIDVKNKSIVDFDGGTHSVESDNSGTAKITATGWGAPTIKVNGAATDVVGVSAWKFISVTSGTAFAASAIIFGKEASWYNGQIAFAYCDKTALSAMDINQMFQNTRHLFGV